MIAVLAFLLLRDGASAQALIGFIPMERAAGKLILFGDVTRAVVFGSVATALLRTFSGIEFELWLRRRGVRRPGHPAPSGRVGDRTGARRAVPDDQGLGAASSCVWARCRVMDNFLDVLTAKQAEVST